MAMRLEIPSFAYDYNYAYSGTSTNMPNSSKYYPSYSYYEANTAINKDNNPAFVFKAKAGVQGKGFTYYGQTSQASAEIQSNLPVFKEITHFWAQAVPDNLNAPVGLCYIQPTLTVYASEGPDPAIFTKTQTFNFGMFVGVEHNLMFACTNSSYYPPYLYDTGIDMSAYLYPSTTQNTDAYAGHTYGLIRIPENNSFGFYVDNIDTKLFEMTEANMLANAIEFTDQTGYWPMLVEMYNNFGGAIENVYSSGAGFYYSNTTASMNVRNQGNVYFSDWYCYVHILEPAEFNAGLSGNFSLLPAAKNYSYYGVMQNCNMLTSVVIPGSVKNIPNNFITGNSVSRVVLQNGITTISANAVVSNSPLILDVPQTAYNISANAAAAPSIEIPAISYNVIERGKLFGNNVNVQQLNRYETIVGLNINNEAIPDKFFKPNNYWVAANNVPINITMLNTQASITKDENGQLVIAYKNFSANVEFDQDVDQTVHSQLVGWHAYNMNDTGFMANVFSREFPHQAHIIRPFNFINDGGFILKRLPLSDCMVDIVGHINGNFTDIPDIVDNAYIVNTVNFEGIGAPFNVAPADMTIHVPPLIANYNYATTDRNAFPVYKVRSINNAESNITIEGGEAVWIYTSNSPNCVISIHNVNHAYVDVYGNPDIGSTAAANITFDNCNYRYIANWPANVEYDPMRPEPRHESASLDDLLNLTILPQGFSMNANDWSDRDTVHFNNFHQHCGFVLGTYPYQEYGALERVNARNWFNVNVPLMSLNNYNSTPEEAMVRSWRNYYYEGGYNYIRGNMAYINLPANLVLSNLMGDHPTFVNSTGNCNIYIDGLCIPGPEPLFSDFSELPSVPIFKTPDINSILNISVNVTRAVAAHDMLTASPIYNATDSRLYLVEGNVHYNTVTHSDERTKVEHLSIRYTTDEEVMLSANDRIMVDQAAAYAWRVALTNCDINYIDVYDNASLMLNNCNVNYINFHGGNVHWLNINYCNVVDTVGLQQLLTAATNCVRVTGRIGAPYHLHAYYRRGGVFRQLLPSNHPLVIAVGGTATGQGEYASTSVDIDDDVNMPDVVPGISVTLYTGGSLYYNGRTDVSVSSSGARDQNNAGSVVLNMPEFLHSSLRGNYSLIDLCNTRAIGPKVFQDAWGMSVTYKTHVSIHPNCCNNSPTIAALVEQGDGMRTDPYPVGVNVTYASNRYTTYAPVNFGDISHMLNVNIVMNDGTEHETDFTIWPPFGYNTVRRNTFHVVHTPTIDALVPAPYGYYMSEATPNTANYYNAATGSTDVSKLYLYDIDMDKKACSMYGLPSGTASTRGEIAPIYPLNSAKDTIVLKGNYSSHLTTLYFFRDIIDTNSGMNTNKVYAMYGASTTYDRMLKRHMVANSINWKTSVANSNPSFGGTRSIAACIHTVILSGARPSSGKVFGASSFANSGVSHIYAPFAVDNINGSYPTTITGTKYINSYAVVNEDYLYHVDFGYYAAANLVVNANAFVNVPMLRFMTLPKNTKSVGLGAFNRTGLVQVNIPTGCTVSTNAFPADCVITYY